MKPFKDPIAPKERVCSKDFKGPTKEEATTGRYMSAGDNYGSGFKNPVGSDKVSSKSPIPRKPSRHNPDEIA